MAAAVFTSPGNNVHEGICTPIWGTPDLDTVGAMPTLSVAEVNKPDGTWLMEQVRGGMVRAVTVQANLETRWREIPVTVAEIRGATVPEEFVLVHGHLDSWGEGIGDNATGDATLLELARALHENRQNLARSVRVAWWSGHSHGRYAGSTWYADTFGLDLIEHCVAQVNCDSPGCRWATEYRNLSCTPDLGAFTQAVIRDITGLAAEGERPPRAGDYSFNNLGISGTLMLSSTMPQSVADEHNYYAVGGCGGNIAWHTVDDTLEIADRDNLERDIKVYGGVVWRLANAPILPLDLVFSAGQRSRRKKSPRPLAPKISCRRCSVSAAWQFRRPSRDAISARICAARRRPRATRRSSRVPRPSASGRANRAGASIAASAPNGTLSSATWKVRGCSSTTSPTRSR